MTNNQAASVFITGAAGVLGRALVRHMVAAGHKVTAAVENSDDAAAVRALGALPTYPHLARAGEIRSAMQVAKATIIVNLFPQIANTLPHTKADWRPDVLEHSGAALVEAAQAAGAEYLLHTSYAFTDSRAENATVVTNAARAAERAVRAASIPAAVLRFGFLYSADSPELVHLREALAAGRTIDSGPDDAKAAWVSVDDALSAILSALAQRPTGELLHIVDDEPASPAAFVRYMAESLGVKAPGRLPAFAAPIIGPNRLQTAIMGAGMPVNNRDAKKMLGWSLKYPTYRQGIDDMLLTWRAAAPVHTPEVPEIPTQETNA